MELLPCPFCGLSEILEHKYEFGIKLSCEKCGCYEPTDISESNILWNTRNPWYRGLGYTVTHWMPLPKLPELK